MGLSAPHLARHRQPYCGSCGSGWGGEESGNQSSIKSSAMTLHPSNLPPSTAVSTTISVPGCLPRCATAPRGFASSPPAERALLWHSDFSHKSPQKADVNWQGNATTGTEPENDLAKWFFSLKFTSFKTPFSVHYFVAKSNGQCCFFA